MSLQEQNEQRKERLKALRNLHGKRPAEDQNPIKFKQYEPETESLQQLKVEPPALGPLAEDLDTVEKRAEEIQAAIQKEEAEKNPELDLYNLAPKKPNWDLKRDLQKKMDKLERLTDVAIADLIRARLKESGDLAGAVGVENPVQVDDA